MKSNAYRIIISKENFSINWDKRCVVIVNHDLRRWLKKWLIDLYCGMHLRGIILHIIELNYHWIVLRLNIN